MFRHITVEGFPTGPLNTPVPVYRASSQSKYHFTSDCLPNLTASTQSLLSIPDNRRCTRCGDVYPLGHRVWADRCDDLRRTRDIVARILRDGVSGRDMNLESHWGRIGMLLLDLDHSSAASGLPVELVNWVRTHLEADARTAHAMLTNHLGRTDRWSVRWLATERVGIDSTEVPDTIGGNPGDYPALCSPSVRSSTRRYSGGQGAVMRDIRDATAAAYITGLAPAECTAAGITAGTATMAEEETYECLDQVRLDVATPSQSYDTIADMLVATWRTQVIDDIASFAQACTTMMIDATAEQDATPRQAFAVQFNRDAAGPFYDADALFLHHIVDVLSEDTFLAIVPAGMKSLVRDMRRLTRRNNFGDVQPTDTIETFRTAHELFENDIAKPGDAAADLARATLAA